MGGWTRRDFLRAGVAAPAGLAAARLLAACGGGEKAATTASPSAKSSLSGRPVKVGFIALTDCASIVMAHELGYFKDAGLTVEVIKQASWPATRDNLLNGQIDAAHCLFSMPLSMAAGIGGTPDQVLKIAMVLNNNGQAITLNKDFAAAGYGDLAKAKTALTKKKDATLAMTFPGGTHDTWLRYWLMAAGVPAESVKIIPIPPPQMVANMKVGAMDGFCVGEPWPAQAATEGVGFTTITTQDIWKDHPEKALVVNPTFAESRKGDLKAVMGAVLKASKWLDDEANRSKAAKTIGVPGYVGAAPEVIEGRMLGNYDLGAGLGKKTFKGDQMRFHRDGETNLARKSYAIWFLAQYRRFGLLKQAPNYKKVAEKLIIPDLYAEVAEAQGVKAPDDDMQPFRVKLDSVEFDPKAPEKEAMRK